MRTSGSCRSDPRRRRDAYRCPATGGQAQAAETVLPPSGRPRCGWSSAAPALWKRRVNCGPTGNQQQRFRRRSLRIPSRRASVELAVRTSDNSLARPQSGKFAANAAGLACAVLAPNRLFGVEGGAEDGQAPWRAGGGNPRDRGVGSSMNRRSAQNQEGVPTEVETPCPWGVVGLR